MLVVVLVLVVVVVVVIVVIMVLVVTFGWLPNMPACLPGRPPTIVEHGNKLTNQPSRTDKSLVTRTSLPPPSPPVPRHNQKKTKEDKVMMVETVNRMRFAAPRGLGTWLVDW